MSNIDNELDQEILALFQPTLSAMKISNRRVQLAMNDLILSPMDFAVRDKLEHDGLEADEYFSFELPEVLAPHLYLKYEQRPVIVYQRDQFLPLADYEKGKLRPFHLCYCSALREAQKKNRYESRYVFTYNTSGIFKVNLWIRDKNSENRVYTIKKEQNIPRRLRVCQHCLHEINWHKFRSYCGGGLEWWRGGNAYQRRKIVEEFDLEEYFLTAVRDNFLDHPVMGTESSTIRKEYVLSPQIKKALKEIVGYTCEICRRGFSSGELQIHHKNHNEGDNRRDNLMVVCKVCHNLIHAAEGGFILTKPKTTANYKAPLHDKRRDGVKKYRVYELAKEFNQDIQVIVDFLKKRKIKIVNRFSAVGEETYELIKGKFDWRSEIHIERNEESTGIAEYAAAQKNLGDMYANGWGVAPDKAKAQNFYKNAADSYKRLADSGDVDAQYELANLRLNDGDYEGFVDIFKKYVELANNGSIRAKIRVGLMSAKGLGVAQDLKEAKKILASVRKKVKIPTSELIELCQLVGNIDDAQRFHAKAVQLFEVAASHGDTAASFELANLYGNTDLIGSEYEED